MYLKIFVIRLSVMIHDDIQDQVENRCQPRPAARISGGGRAAGGPGVVNAKGVFRRGGGLVAFIAMQMASTPRGSSYAVCQSSLPLLLSLSRSFPFSRVPADASADTGPTIANSACVGAPEMHRSPTR